MLLNVRENRKQPIEHLKVAPHQKVFLSFFLFQANAPGEASSPKTSLPLVSFFHSTIPDSDNNNNIFFCEAPKCYKE